MSDTNDLVAEMVRRSRDLSAWLEPPRWRIFRRRRWRKHQQPADILEYLRDVLTGEVEPVRREGWIVK